MLKILLVLILTIAQCYCWNLTPLGSPRIIFSDTTYLAKLTADLKAPTIYATAFKNFVDSGIASGGSGGSVYLFTSWHAAMIYMVTKDTSYCTFAVSDADKIVTQEETLISQGSNPTVAGDSYLDVGPMVMNIMAVYDWCRAQTTSAQRTRWMNYANQAVSNVWNCSTATWGGRDAAWSCWSIDDPGNNYYYSFLKATMMTGLATYGENSSADMWLRQFRNVKLGNQLIPYFNKDLTTGGSLEGTGYGISHKELFNLYDWWKRSTGEDIGTMMPHTYYSLQWMLQQMVPQLDMIANIGDQARDSSASFYDYHRHYILVLCQMYPTSQLAIAGKLILKQSSVPQMMGGFNSYADYMFDLRNVPDIQTLNASYITNAWRGESTGTLVVRTSWEKDAVYLNQICGPYVQYHSHLDQGSYLLYHKGWMAMDQNYNSHGGIQQGSNYHNMIRIEVAGTVIPQEIMGVCNMSALSDNTFYTYSLSLVTPMYANSGKVKKVERELIFIKPSTVVVFDRVVTVAGSGASRISSMNFMSKPTNVNGKISYSNGQGSISVSTLSPSTNLNTNIVDWTVVDSDNNAGYRVDFVDTSTSNETNFLQVISLNSSVVSSTRSDVSGMIGATISLTDGRSATVRFNTASTGGSIALVSAQQKALVNENLTTGKQALGVGAPVVPVSSPRPIPQQSVIPVASNGGSNRNATNPGTSKLSSATNVTFGLLSIILMIALFMFQ